MEYVNNFGALDFLTEYVYIHKRHALHIKQSIETNFGTQKRIETVVVCLS